MAAWLASYSKPELSLVGGDGGDLPLTWDKFPSNFLAGGGSFNIADIMENAVTGQCPPPPNEKAGESSAKLYTIAGF